MKFNTKKDGTHLTIELDGELNTITAPSLSECIDTNSDGVEALTLDFRKCDYVASAGIRVLLRTFKDLKPKNISMKLVNVGPVFEEVLEATNLDGVFDYETI